MSLHADPLDDPAVVEDIFHAALTNRDWPALDAALRRLCVIAPRRAVELYDTLKAGLLLRRALGIDPDPSPTPGRQP